MIKRGKATLFRKSFSKKKSLIEFAKNEFAEQ